jgi:hypothetical protein
MRQFAFAMLIATTLLPAQETYVLGPDSLPQPGVQQGSVTKYELKAGRFYPGTPHTYSVYLPAEEPTLIRYAYDFEQITGQRKDPPLFPPLP